MSRFLRNNNTVKMENSLKIFGFTLLLFHLTTSYGRPLSMAISSAPSNLSPFFSTDANSQNINRLVHLSLVDFDQNMEVVCRLCTTFEERKVGEEHRIVFNLDKESRFWNGEIVRAEDVEKSWKYFTEESKIKSIFRFAFSKIKKIIVHSPLKVELVYEKYHLDSLSNLVLLKILRIEDESKPYEIMGAGPYKYGKLSDESVHLVPINRQKEELLIKVVKDETTLALKLINGEIDLSLANISPRKIKWLKKNSELQILQRKGAGHIYLGINHQNIHLKDLRVRMALSHLIARKKIITFKLENTAVIANSLFSSQFSALYRPELKTDDYSPSKAAKLLMESGYRKNSEGKWQKDGNVLEMIWKVSNNKASIELVDVMKEEFEKNGIEITKVIQEWGTFFGDIKKGNFDIFTGQWIGFTGPEMLKHVFHSQSIPPQGANRGRFSDRELDDYIDLASKKIVKSERNAVFKKAISRARSLYPYLDLWHPDVIWIVKNCVKNINLYPTGSFLALLDVENHCAN